MGQIRCRPFRFSYAFVHFLHVENWLQAGCKLQFGGFGGSVALVSIDKSESALGVPYYRREYATVMPSFVC